MAGPAQRVSGRRLARAGWEQVTIYLPVILMGFMALGTYWLAQNSPLPSAAQEKGQATHDPDQFMRGFSIKTFDPAGRLKSEVYGTEARHYPDTDTLEIDQPRIRAFNEKGEVTTATARKAISNADGSEVQLLGNAVVARDASTDAQGHARPRLELRSEFLQAYMNTEKVKTHKPVEITRGTDRFTADSLDFDNVDQVLDLRGRVNGVLGSRPAS